MRMSFAKFRFILLLLIPLLFVTHSTNTFAQKRKKKKEATEQQKPLEPWEVDTLLQPIPMNRALFTDKVKTQQQRLDSRDGTVDNRIQFMDEDYSAIATKALIQDVDLLEIHIENMTIEHGQKIQFHRDVEQMLARINTMRWGNLQPVYFTKIVDNLSGMIVAITKNNLNDYVANNINKYTLANSSVLEDYPDAKATFFKAYGTKYPEEMIKKLESISKEPYADDIVAAVAKKNPGAILNYATSTSFMATVVRRNQDPMVQAIVKIADQSKAPLKALPFLGDIYNGKKTVSQVDAFINDDVQYFKNLVQLKLDNQAIAGSKIDEEIEYRALKFVRTINELHESPDAVRFKSIQPFDAPDLYYMIIGGQDEIYTSSFTHGTFPLMMQKMKPETGDELLAKVHKDHFRTFIRLCAGFNTLSEFLATIDVDKKTALMKEFAANLERGDEDELEDAVDVADAFGSITDPELQSFLRKEVVANYERVGKTRNANTKKGLVVYGLLSTIFNPDKSAQLKLPIPPVTYVPYSSLVNNKNEIVIHAYFYGDEDGAMSFGSFKSNFPSPQWKVAQNKNWVTYTNTSGKNPIVVYANLPLKEPQDEEAQEALQKYLDDNEISPTMVIHRGHSYHLEGSLENLTPEVKIVMLGSCGGYHNLANVLDRSPDANIISSKQTGAARINEPIINIMLKQIMAGKDVDWPDDWKELDTYFSKKTKEEQDLFSDYVPPHKNLGAIFIKAYRKMMAGDLG